MNKHDTVAHLSAGGFGLNARLQGCEACDVAAGDRVRSVCPTCGELTDRVAYDVGSGPELSCADCEWCWGANGQALTPVTLRGVAEAMSPEHRKLSGIDRFLPPESVEQPPTDHGSDRYDYVELIDAPPHVAPHGEWWEALMAEPCPDCRANIFARWTGSQVQPWRVSIAHDDGCPTLAKFEETHD